MQVLREAKGFGEQCSGTSSRRLVCMHDHKETSPASAKASGTSSRRLASCQATDTPHLPCTGMPQDHIHFPFGSVDVSNFYLLVAAAFAVRSVH